MTKFDDESLHELGVRGRGIVPSGGIVRYVAGCITRERERLARALKGHISEEAIAAILSNKDDSGVFKWVGPHAKLDDPVKPADTIEVAREKLKGDRGDE